MLLSSGTLFQLLLFFFWCFLSRPPSRPCFRFFCTCPCLYLIECQSVCSCAGSRSNSLQRADCRGRSRLCTGTLFRAYHTRANSLWCNYVVVVSSSSSSREKRIIEYLGLNNNDAQTFLRKDRTFFEERERTKTRQIREREISQIMLSVVFDRRTHPRDYDSI